MQNQIPMIKRGICPACGSKDIHVNPTVGREVKGTGLNIMPIGWFDIAKLDNYVCVNCGYVESYVGNPRDRERIAKKWPKVGGTD